MRERMFPLFGNWPTSDQRVPDSMADAISLAECARAQAEECRRDADAEIERCRCAAWVEYHDAHGWPEGDAGYEQRVRGRAGSGVAS